MKGVLLSEGNFIKFSQRQDVTFFGFKVSSHFWDHCSNEFMSDCCWSVSSLVVFGGKFSIIREKISTTFHNFRQVIYIYDKKYRSLDTNLRDSTQNSCWISFHPVNIDYLTAITWESFNHSKTLKPYDLSLPSSLSWGALPNALAKSKYVVSTTPPDTIVSMHLSR